MATQPTLKVEIAFGSTPLDTTPTYTDVTSYVRATGGYGVSIVRTGDPGSCTLTLSNRDRRFDASYSPGPFFGQLLPRTPMRLTANWASVDYPMFTGWVTGFPQTFTEVGKDSVVSIEAVDALVWLGTAKLPIDLMYSYANTTIGSLAFFLRQGSSARWSDATSNGFFATATTGTPRTAVESTPVDVLRVGFRTGRDRSKRNQSTSGRNRYG